MGRRRQMDIEKDAPKIGHNSNLSTDDQRKLAGYISEIERVELEITVLNTDRSEIYKTLKENHFDTKAVRHVVKLRKMERSERDAFESAISSYQLSLDLGAPATV